MAREFKDQPLDPENCMHPGRPAEPRADSKPWHCDLCDTSFIVSELIKREWREL